MNEKIKSPSGQGGAGGGAPSGPSSSGATHPGGGPTPPSSQIGSGPPNIGGPPTTPNNGNDSQTAPQHPYGGPLNSAGPDPQMSHYHHHQQPHPHPQQQLHPHQQQQQQHPGPAGVPSQNPGEHPHGKDDYAQSAISGPPPPPGGHHAAYGRYHQLNDPYAYGHSPMQQQPPPGGKPQQQQQQQPPPPTGPGGSGGGISSPSRPPPQRYIPGQPPQGPTPTLNSLLQSSHPPPPPQHRYANSYDQQQQQQQPSSQQQQQQQQPGGPPQGPHGPPPPPHQPYGGQQGGWAPPPRPYSPQMGPSQAYRTPPPTNTSRGQSPYPPTHGQNSGSYPSSPQQQPGGPPPPPQSSNQGTATSQYSPYPQRYPTPPGPATGPNHRTAYSTHQYPEPNRPWPGGSSPAASPGPGGHPHPPASPHQAQHGGPSSSPGHAPSPSPQPSQASPSPHQELIGQNSNDSSSGGGHSGMGSGPPGTPNPQQVMRPTPSPTGSSGSRSMSPAVAQNHPISRPSSNQSSSGPMQQSGIPPHMAQNIGVGPPSTSQQQSQQQSQLTGGSQNSSSSAGNSPQQPPQGAIGGVAPNAQQQQSPPNQSVNNMPTQPPPGSAGGYPPPPHMHGGYKMGPGGAGQNSGPSAQGMTSGYPPPQQAQQYSQGNYPPRPQYPPSNYAPAAPPPPTNQSSSANSMPPVGPQQYPGRPMQNHSGAGGPSPHSQFPPYQNWVPPTPQGHATGPGANALPGSGSMVGNHIQGKGTPPPGGPPPPHTQGGSSGSPRPLNYLKQHLQHKGGGSGGYGASPTPPQGYGNGPGMHPGMPMGPPHHMGPPHGPTSMGPPTSTPPQGGGMLSGNIPPGGGISEVGAVTQPDHISQDNGISSSGSSSASCGPGGPHAVTSVVTTGPDGTPIDEVSQQSTLSNASAASGEDPQCTTPKSRKNDPYSQSHLAPPSTSPGGVPHAPHPGVVEEYEMNSPPNWTRTPASPVFNSHVVPPPETFRTTNKKSDSLCKLYEMDDNPERRGWLDKLRAFMEERRTPITACPTISKQPLDLYRLYIYVKERGGFVEVTKSKTWKDIAGLLGIGASSSAAYTLRKHYTKNLLAFECHFDRGDIDPLPIIQQVEAGTKKKSTKAASVPSPGKSGTTIVAPPTPAGSSNSQDSFPAPGAAPNASIDGYPGYPGGYPGAGAQQDYNAAGQIQRPPSQSNAQTPHAGSPYPGQPGAYGQYGAGDQYNSTGPTSGQFGQNQGQFPPQNRNMYPPYGPEGEAPPPGSNTYAPYGNRPYSQPPPGSTQSPTPPNTNVSGAAGGPPTAGPGAAPAGTYPPGAPGQQDYYRPPEPAPQPRRHPDFVKDSQPYPGYNARPQMYGGWQGSSNQYRGQYPSSPSPQAWGNAPPRTTAPGGPAGQLGPPNQQAAAAAQWEQHRYAPQQAPPPQQQPPYQQQPNQQQQTPPPPQWAQMGATGNSAQSAQAGVTPGSPLRPPQNSQQQQQLGQRMPGIGAVMPPTTQQQGMPPTVTNAGQSGPPSNIAKPPPFAMPPPQTSAAGAPCGTGGVGSPAVVGAPGPTPMLGGTNVAGVPSAGIGIAQKTTAAHVVQPPQVAAGSHQASTFPPPPTAQLQKKEINFPPESVEATTPVLYRRKRLAKSDVCPIDPWRLFMAMRSGLLTECTWALDVLNVLLFDDTTVQYFGLQHLPGLLTLLLEHFQKQLAEMFNELEDEDKKSQQALKKSARCVKSICSYNRKRHYENNDERRLRTANVAIGSNSKEDAESSDDEGIDLGQVRMPANAEERVLMLSNTPNYTLMSRKGLPVRIQPAETDIFVVDGQKSWDIDTNKLYEQTMPIGSNAWTYGYTERDPHDGIIDVFKSEIIDIPFARFISGGEHNNPAPDKRRDSDYKPGMASQDETHDADTQKLLQTFNKKRRIFNNTTICTNSSIKTGSVEPAKKPKLYEGHDVEFLQPEIKKETLPTRLEVPDASFPTDSDCREVDMELEPALRLANGHQSAANSKTFDPRCTLRDPALVLQRRRDSSFEDECYTRDEASLYLVNESQDALARRCICLSNIFRNLTFVPGNETILAKSSRFLAILGRLLLLNHEHLQRTPKTRNYDREEDTDFSDSCSSLQGEREWWWEYLISIRENMLVAMANIAGHLELSRYEELIARPLIDGLLHWAVCPSAHGQDPFPSCGPNTALSPQRLALESLCKLCVTDANVDLVIATPPHSRLEKLCAVLTRHLCRNEDQVLREFSVNLLHYLAAADSAMARTVALQSPCISYLVAFIEQAEQTALGVANQHGINYLRENPDSMGTSLDMLRRAAGTLLHLAKHPDNRSLFMQQEQRLLGLVMSHILDQQVALIISRVLFQVSRGPGPMPSMEYRMQQRQQQQQHDADKKSPPSRAAVETATTSTASSAIGDKHRSEVLKNIDLHTATAGGHHHHHHHHHQLHTQQQAHELANSNSNCSTSSNASSSKPAPTTTASGDENSNSNLPPVATLNDVSNSSTNSSSCGAASSNSSHYGGVATTHAAVVNNSAALVTTMSSEQQLMSGNKNINISTTTATITGNNLSSSNNSSSNNSSSCSNSSSINNISSSSNNTTNLLHAASNTNATPTTTTLAAVAAQQQLTPVVNAAAATTAVTAASSTPTASSANTTAAVA